MVPTLHVDLFYTLLSVLLLLLIIFLYHCCFQYNVLITTPHLYLLCLHSAPTPPSQQVVGMVWGEEGVSECHS